MRREASRRVGLAALLLFALALVIACSGPASASAAPSADNAAIAADFAAHRTNVEVTAHGSVERLLSDESSDTGLHQRFILKLTGSTQTLLITNNVSIGKRVPVVVGDDVVVHGEYVWNDQGGLVHFTHHDPQHTHPDGWIERQGIRYD